MTAERSSRELEHLLAEAGWARSLARALVRNDADADDVIQDAWLDALRSPPPEAGSLRGWLRTVVKRTALDLRRSDRRRRRREGEGAIEAGAATPSTDQSIARLESQQLLLSAVESLGPLEREIVVLRYFDQLAPRRIAVQLGVSTEVVKSRLRRAKEHLRAILLQHGVRSDSDLRFALAPLLGLERAASSWTSGRPSTRAATVRGARRLAAPTAAIATMCLVFAVAIAVLRLAGSTLHPATIDAASTMSTSGRDSAAQTGRRRHQAESSDEAGVAQGDVHPAGSPARRHRALGVVLAPVLDGVEFATLREHRAGQSLPSPWRRIRLEGARLPVEWTEGETDVVVAFDIAVDHPHACRRSLRFSPAEATDGVVEVRIPPAVPVHGTVTATAVPGGAVTVYAFAAANESSFTNPEDSCASVDGAPFELRLRDGVDYRIIALGEDSVPAQCMVRAADGANAGALVCVPGLAISGTIERVGFGAEAGPLTLMFERSGVARSFMLPDGSAIAAFEDGTLARRVGFAPIAADGSFRIAGLAEGAHRLSVTARDTTLLGCVLEPSAELTPSKSPVKLLLGGTEVVLLAPGLPDGTLVLARADNVVATTAGRVADGRCCFIAPLGVNLTFWAGKGALSRSVERPPGHASSRVELAAPSIAIAEVVLECVDSGQGGPRGATCELRTEDGRPLFVSERAEFVDGRAVVRLPDVGRAELVVRPWTRRESRHRDWWVPDVRKIDTGTRPVLRLSPKQGGRLTFICRDAEGRPIMGRVRLTGPAGEMAVQCEIRTDGGTVPGGAFLGPEGVTELLDPLPPGLYHVVIESPTARQVDTDVSVEQRATSAVRTSRR